MQVAVTTQTIPSLNTLQLSAAGTRTGRQPTIKLLSHYLRREHGIRTIPCQLSGLSNRAYRGKTDIDSSNAKRPHAGIHELLVSARAARTGQENLVQRLLGK